MIGWQEE